MKKLGIVLMTLVCCLCVSVDVIYFCFIFTMPDKKVPDTFNVSEMTNASGTETKTFAEIMYYSNKNKNGLEMFEIKFNYFTDESKENFFSQGVQYIASDINQVLSFTPYVNNNYGQKNYKYSDKTLWKYYNRYYFCSYFIGSENKRFDYQSGDDYKTTSLSTNPISYDSSFTIDLLGSGLYKMEFKNIADFPSFVNSEFNESTFSELPFYNRCLNAYSEWKGFYSNFYDYYYYISEDYTYLIWLLFNAAKNMPSGTNGNKIFEFADIFNYYKYDESSKTYSQVVDGQNLEKVKNDVKSYYVLKFNVSDDGARVADDSLFNEVEGSANFNLWGSFDDIDYFYDRDVINVSVYDFDYFKLENGQYELKLKDEFINYYYKFKDDIVLYIKLDLDVLKENGIEFTGFTENSGFNNFVIYKCVITQSQGGEIVESEVNYD